MDQATYDRELERRFQYPPPSPGPQAFDDAATGRLADANYFRAFTRYERAYSDAGRIQAQRLADQLAQDAGQLTHDQFTLRVSEIVALADNAHSHTGPAFQKNTRRLPLRTYWFADGLYVVRAASAHTDLLGARIDAIDGISLEQVYRAIRRYNGGTEQWRRLALTPMLESPGLLNAAGVARDGDALTLSGVLSNGARFERRIEGEERGPAAPISATSRLIYPAAPDAALRSLLSRDQALPFFCANGRRFLRSMNCPAMDSTSRWGTQATRMQNPLAPFLTARACASVRRNQHMRWLICASIREAICSWPTIGRANCRLRFSGYTS
jgi:hypothetical protein